MLKKIKNLFKWIADHTGISWITKKVSSGWNWLFIPTLIINEPNKKHCRVV